MRRVSLKYTGTKTSEQLGSAMVPESTLIISKSAVARLNAKIKSRSMVKA